MKKKFANQTVASDRSLGLLDKVDSVFPRLCLWFEELERGNEAKEHVEHCNDEERNLQEDTMILDQWPKKLA